MSRDEQVAATASRLTLLQGEDNPDEEIDFAWRPFKVVPTPSPPRDGCRTCHHNWDECEC